MKFLKVILLILIFIGTERFCHYQTKGFAISKIISNLPHRSDWEVSPLSQEEHSFLENILNQKFIFLGGGGSFYAFASEDQNYVIKFFKMHHLNPIPRLRPYIGPILDRHKKRERVFDSCKFAYNDLKEETGVIYIHLNKTKGLHKNIIIVDNLGIEHSIPLDSIEFVVQKKAVLAPEYIAGLMKSGRPDLAKDALKSVWHLMESIIKKGYDGRDMNVATNFGFINGKAVQIDIGPFKKANWVKARNFYKNRLYRSARKLDLWLQETYPELSKHFEEKAHN
ncbi:MAG TPA: hypothetical protein VLG49_04800 [Rhabdochlamydiaceae bacterium]|nr:hypothetical protein [Rhabdochlamydiaceae bacterium]